MIRQRRCPSWFSSISLLISGIALVASLAAAGELVPEVEEIPPVSDSLAGDEAGAPESPAPRLIRRLPLKTRAEQLSAAQPAQALPEPTESEALAAVTTSFVGLNQVNAGGLVPPDTIVGKSNTRVLEAVNVSLRLFTTTGGVLATKTLNSFFGASTSQGTLFDPKVYFDRNAANRRFYVVALQQSGSTDASGLSRIWLGISRSPDPANLEPANWCRYFINGKRNAGTALSSWADYPGLGVGADKVVISANQFTFTNDAFTFAILRVFNKLTAANNAASCPSISLFTFQPSGASANFSIFTLQPAQHYTSPSSFTGTSNPVYLLNTARGTSSSYRVWRVRNINPPSLQGPTLVSGNFTYAIQPDAPQAGSAVLLDTGDTRVTQVAGLGNALRGVHGTSCNFGGGANESCVRYVRISVGQSSTGAFTAAINDQATTGFGAGDFIFWPGVAVNNAGLAAIDYHRNRNAAGVRFLSSLVTTRNANAFVQSFFITSGTCGQPFNRTGDYIGAQTDPSDVSSFWLAGERATTVSGSCRWQTQIIKLVP